MLAAHAANAPVVPPVSPPLPLLAAMLLALAVSSVMFWLLVWRSTSHRRWIALSDWGRESGFRFHPRPPRRPPPPLDAVRGLDARVQAFLSGRRGGATEQSMLLQVQTDVPRKNAPDPADGGPRADPAVAGSATAAAAAALGSPRQALWNLLVRPLEAAWPPTGARPAGAADSFLDLFSLSSFPLMGNSDRFVIYGVDSAPARALARSSARALLPPDVGLLLTGRHLVLDFSGRPFDGIEFNRMLGLADQIVAHLPPPA